MFKFKSYINGKFVSGSKEVEIIGPHDNKVVGTVASLSKEDIDKAFSSAREAFDGWRRTTVEQRIEYLNKFAELMLASKEKLAEIMHAEIAKTISDGIVEVERTAEYIADTISSYKEIRTKKMKVGKKVNHITRIPLGVVLAISPFNYPVNLALSKIAPALLAGNTVVFKPATNGSLTGSFLGELFSKIGLPNGVFNLVTGKGSEIGDALIENKEIDMISFTGGVRVGKEIAAKKHMIPLVLELGGNDAAYIRHDADLDLAAAQVLKGAFSYSGQRCTAIKRVILHKDIAYDFKNKLKAIMDNIKPVPLVTKSAANYVKELMEDARDNGSNIIFGGTYEGNLIEHTLIETNPSSRVWNEEPFGPILPMTEVSTDEEAIKLMNDTNFGLQNSIFTKDNKWAISIGEFIESGSLNINASSSRGPDIFPFLGVKDSGFGTQGIEEAIVSMTRIINVVDNG